MKKKIDKKEIVIGLILLVVLVVSFFIDKYIYFFKDGIPVLIYLFSLITHLGNFFVVLFVVSALLYKSKWFKPFIFSLLASSLAGIVIKFLVQKSRPFTIEFFPFGLIDYSFPSFHAVSAVVGLIFLDKAYPKLRIVWIVLGFLILFSRIYLGMHYFSDVVFGGIVAYFVAKIFISKWS